MRLPRARSATDARDRAVVYRVAGLVLDYPVEELRAEVPALRTCLAGLPAGTGLNELLEHLERTPVDLLQADYVETFDLRRRASLYLTYYAYGDTRKRGVALLQVKNAYSRAGMELTADELPDHLCVMLEFAATVDVEAGTKLLLDHRAGLEVLRLSLADAGSPYAGALTAVCATLPPLAGNEREAIARLAAEGPPEEEVGLEPYAAAPELSPPMSGVHP